MYKVCAYITSYNDLEAVNNCIFALGQQTYPIEKIHIIDNSSQPITLEKEENKITIDHHPENIGISGGLKIGIKKAIAEGYDFLWTFDQDSQPLPDVLEKLLNNYDNFTKSGQQIGIIAPLPIDDITGQVWHGIVFDKYKFIETNDSKNQLNTYECDAVITSGSLVSLSAAKKVDLPEEGFFIVAVDWDYCLKFLDKNYKIYVVKDAIIKHRFGNSRPDKAIFRKREVMIYNYSALRYYYMCRNHTFIETRLASLNGNLARSVLRRFKFLAIILIKIIFYERSQTLLKIWACLKGTYDGFRGKLGKTWQ